MLETAPSVHVKICGLTRPDDARAAADAGADYLGTVLVPTSPRAVTPAGARRIAEGLSIPLVLVSADADPGLLADRARSAGARVLQLHGDETPDDLRRLRDEGEWTLWKAICVRGVDDAARGLERFGDEADALLLDGWHPDERGGSGTRFPWEEVREVRDSFPPGLDLVVAGGLTPENVGRAVELLGPEVVDVSSGVERRPGVKDPSRLRAFAEAARSALREAP